MIDQIRPDQYAWKFVPGCHANKVIEEKQAVISDIARNIFNFICPCAAKPRASSFDGSHSQFDADLRGVGSSNTPAPGADGDTGSKPSCFSRLLAGLRRVFGWGGSKATSGTVHQAPAAQRQAPGHPSANPDGDVRQEVRGATPWATLEIEETARPPQPLASRPHSAQTRAGLRKPTTDSSPVSLDHAADATTSQPSGNMTDVTDEPPLAAAAKSSTLGINPAAKIALERALKAADFGNINADQFIHGVNSLSKFAAQYLNRDFRYKYTTKYLDRSFGNKITNFTDLQFSNLPAPIFSQRLANLNKILNSHLRPSTGEIAAERFKFNTAKINQNVDKHVEDHARIFGELDNSCAHRYLNKPDGTDLSDEHLHQKNHEAANLFISLANDTGHMLNQFGFAIQIH